LRSNCSVLETHLDYCAMKELYLSLLLVALFINHVVSNRFCPNVDAIYPCRCLPITANQWQLECSGESFDDKALQAINRNIKTDTGRIHELYIHDSKISDIPPNIFNQVVFTNIKIEYNSGLKTVDPFAFKKGTITSLVIRRNKDLEDLRVYELARYLEPTTTVAFDGNALEEIVANAFTPINSATNTLRNIYLDGNKVEKLHPNAFYGLPNVQLISLQYNEIEEVHAHALRFSSGQTQRNIVVKLNDNQNKEENIDPNAIEVPANVTLSLHLENNELSHLPQYEFRYLETPGNQIFLENNAIVCDCDMRWVYRLRLTESAIGLTCKNFANQNLFTLLETDLCP
jgi:hypothetical protein